MTQQKQNTGESDGLINEEIIGNDPISASSWSEPNQNGLINACCAPLFSVFRRKYRTNHRYRE